MQRSDEFHSSLQNTLELERKILGALCCGLGKSAAPKRIERILAGYAWQDPEHRVVYEAVTSLHARDPRATLEQLPAEATRLGFPAVDWQRYLSTSEVPAISELEQWAVALTAVYP